MSDHMLSDISPKQFLHLAHSDVAEPADNPEQQRGAGQPPGGQADYRQGLDS